MAASSLSRSPLDSAKCARPGVEIHLDDQANAPVPTYSSLDTIRGHVSFTAEADIHFDQVSIMLTGTSRTLIDQPGVATPTVGRSSAFHTFLRLTQPIEEDDYPHPRVLETGRTYTFPFTFVVPERLLPDTCNHGVNHPHVHAQHTHLPPSLGDPTIAGVQGHLLDDLAPDTVQIQYAIRARLSKANNVDGNLRTVTEKAKRLRIVPATEEQPPLDVSDDDSMEYRLRNEKDVKKGALRGKMGRLVMSAAQPRPFQLPPLHTTTTTTRGDDEEEEKKESSTTTTATVHMRFDPTDEQQQQPPPRLGTLWTKLKANTFYSTEAWEDLPASSASTKYNVERGTHTQNLCLASRCVASATWQKHSPETTSSSNSTPATSAASTPASSALPSRRCSVESSSSSSGRSSLDSSSSTNGGSPGPSASYSGKTYYTTSILVPLALPQTKAFVPTFHSCLASRTYTLDLSLSYHSKGSTNFSAPHFSIHLPVQVMGPAPSKSLASSRSRDRNGGRQRAGDEFFTPRTIRPPRQEYTERSMLGGGTTPATVSSVHDEDEEDNSVTNFRRPRSDTLSSMASSMRSHRSAPPPEYPLFARQMSNRRVMRTAC